jgi:Flp pilus assembly protein TadD
MDMAAVQSSLPPSAGTPADEGRSLYIQGLLALRNGDSEVAIGLLIEALRRQPTHSGIRRNLVRALLSAGRFDQVLLHADVALAAAPDDAELHFARGSALNGLGRATSACAAFSQAIALQPGHAPSWLNFGNASVDLGDIAGAENLYRTAIRLDPTLPEAYGSLGYVLTLQGRLPEAIDACEAALQLYPTFAQAQWNHAVATLLTGDLKHGFARYEWRKQHASFRHDFPDLPGDRWDGGNPAGRKILIRAEQGMGDVIHFARYLPMIHAAGGRPILTCAPTLVPLIQSMPGVDAVAAGGPLPAYDAWADQMSLPNLMGTTIETIPAATGYLVADPERVEAWRARLPAGRKVGVVFAGSPLHQRDHCRSIPLDVVLPLPAIQGVSFVNLQHGASAAGLGLPDLSKWMTDYAETAALIETLDLVITVDTSVAHLAGALGKPTWILLASAPDWRWMLDRSDSPWYQSVRLFRQQKSGDWTGVLARVFEALRSAI